jgi:L-fuconate dehydratase
MKISRVTAYDLRFPLPAAAGSDAVHLNPVYSLAACVLEADDGTLGTGFTLTLGTGNDLVCEAIRYQRDAVLGGDPDELLAELGTRWHSWANEGQLRWLGPHKGVVHLALAAIVGGLTDLWAKKKQVPLWQGLLEMSPEQVTALIDFSTIDDYLSPEEAIELLETRSLGAEATKAQLDRGYPAYDTSVGWLGYDKTLLVENVLVSKERGYGAVKIKVGSRNLASDVERLAAVREVLGSDALVMIDANQIWGVAGAIRAGKALAEFEPFWFEEPVHPDDLVGYLCVRDALAPMRIAGGEHIPNQVVFKNFLQRGALDVAQPDVVRLGGLPEYLAVALMAAKAGVPVLPHAGDMGQLHQHLIYFTRCRLGMPELPLEMIPHLREHFLEPCTIEHGRYVTPKSPGSSSGLRPESINRFAWRATTPSGHPERL